MKTVKRTVALALACVMMLGASLTSQPKEIKAAAIMKVAYCPTCHMDTAHYDYGSEYVLTCCVCKVHSIPQ